MSGDSMDELRKPPRSLNPQNRRVAPQKVPEVTEVAAELGLVPEVPRPPSKIAMVARAILGAALVVGASVGVAYAARRYVMTTPRFAVSEIAVSGTLRRTPDAVAEEAGIVKGANVFSIDLDLARTKLLADPWIAEATIARRLPGTIAVQIVEREAAAIVALGDSYLASRDGDIFKRLEPGDPSDLPVVTGLSGDGVAQDREGVVAQVRRALDLAADYDHGPLGARSPLEEVHLSGDGRVSLVVGKSGVTLELGSPPFRKKLDEASRVMAELDRRGAKADAIMLDNEARPERVVVRVR